MSGQLPDAAPAPVFEAFARIPLADALRGGLLAATATVSPARQGAVPPPFFFNYLPFQFAVWAHIFFLPAGERHIGQRLALEVLEHRNGRVLGQSGAVQLADGRVLDALLQFIDPKPAGDVFRRVGGELRLLRAAPVEQPGRFFLGVAPAAYNYAHWVTCVLPGWVHYRQHLMERNVRLIVGELTRFQQEALALLGIPDEALFRMPAGIVAFEHLTLLSPIDLWTPPTHVAEAGQYVAQAAMDGREQPGPRRVYLSRRDVATRRLLNEAAAEEMLRQRGFVSLACAELGFREQVRHMAGADIVVGLHGAALGNIVFCRPGTAVIEVFPEYCVQPHFRVLADCAGLPYGFVQGTCFEPENARERNAAWNADFVIDVGLLSSAVDAAEARLPAGR